LVDVTTKRVLAAVHVKAQHTVSYADAFVVAAAEEFIGHHRHRRSGIQGNRTPGYCSMALKAAFPQKKDPNTSQAVFDMMKWREDCGSASLFESIRDL